MRFTFSADQDTKKLVAKIRVSSQTLVDEAMGIFDPLDSLASEALLAAREATPGGGTLRGLWELRRQVAKDRFSYTLQNRAAKSRRGNQILGYLEYGTRPHIIKPRSAKALRFIIGNSVIFAKSVKHPGTRPYGMVSAAEQVFLKGLEKTINSIRIKLRNLFT